MPFRATDFLTNYDFRRHRTPGFVVWTFPSSCRQAGLDADRQASTPSLSGLARDCHFTGFPEFDQFYSASFPAGTHVTNKSVAYTSSATSASRWNGYPKPSIKAKRCFITRLQFRAGCTPSADRLAAVSRIGSSSEWSYDPATT